MVRVGESYSNKKELTFSVPQGSCAGPTLYSIYASTVSEVIPNIIDIHGYADDHAIKTSFQSESKISETEAVNVMENTLASIRSWMSENRLKINDSKTEFIIYGSRQQFKNLSIDSLKVNQTSVTASDFIKYLWVYLDQNLNLKKTHYSKMPSGKH